MTRNVTIAAIQLPVWSEGETDQQRKRFRVESIMHWLEEAGKAKAALACLGETCTGPFEMEDAYTGPTTRMVQKLAERYHMHVVLPLQAYVDGILRNTALIIDDHGQIVGRYDKVHPTRRELRDGIIPGADFPVFDLSFGRLGVCICHDLSFPESTRVLGVRGAEIIVWPTYWSGWGDDICYAVIKSRAIDNGAWLVNTTFGIESHKAWRPGMILGRSGVFGPDGLVLSNAGRYVGMALSTVDLDRPRIAHDFSFPGDNDARTSILADRRPDAYGPLVDPSLVVPPTPPPGFYATDEATFTPVVPARVSA
ncbi:MAG: carbon-nitrogen hydrolase family protein [Caldilineaceae bacterium]|nr:carbon-nitrogen hydrolase family protein [Caldilineaceae bacterium]